MASLKTLFQLKFFKSCLLEMPYSSIFGIRKIIIILL